MMPTVRGFALRSHYTCTPRAHRWNTASLGAGVTVKWTARPFAVAQCVIDVTLLKLGVMVRGKVKYVTEREGREGFNYYYCYCCNQCT